MSATLPQRLARLCIHGHCHVGVDNLGLEGERGVVLELGLDAGSIANEEEARVRVADKRDRRASKDHAWSMVAAHGVERYGDWSSHLRAVPIGKALLITA
jgi:hypothetical protein